MKATDAKGARNGAPMEKIKIKNTLRDITDQSTDEHGMENRPLRGRCVFA